VKDMKNLQNDLTGTASANPGLPPDPPPPFHRPDLPLLRSTGWRSRRFVRSQGLE
jgi:hypothetical protein